MPPTAHFPARCPFMATGSLFAASPRCHLCPEVSISSHLWQGVWAAPGCGWSGTQLLSLPLRVSQVAWVPSCLERAGHPQGPVGRQSSVCLGQSHREILGQPFVMKALCLHSQGATRQPHTRDLSAVSHVVPGEPASTEAARASRHSLLPSTDDHWFSTGLCGAPHTAERPRQH